MLTPTVRSFSVDASLARSFKATGVALYGGHHALETHGRIYGIYGVTLAVSIDNGFQSFITNTGRIWGSDAAVVCSTPDSVSIENSGVIIAPRDDGAGIAIQFDGIAASEVDSVVNSGTIRGAANGILFASTKFHEVDNSGTIIGGISSVANIGDGVLSVTNTGVMKGALGMGAAADIYDGELGRIVGQIYGEEGDDRITGGAEKNRVEGGADGDLLTGGANADFFIYAAAGDSTLDPDGRDLITDFSHKSRDIIDFSTLIPGELDFVGKAHFPDAEQIRYQISGKGTTVFVNLDVDVEAEMAIQFAGKIKFVESDFAV